MVGRNVMLLLSAGLVSLGAGTPYLYSYWAPQFIERCSIPAQSIGTLSYSLNIGSSILGSVAGFIIDRNPQFACGMGVISTFVAYLLIKLCYDRSYGNVPLISFALTLVGFGSVSAFYAAVKCCTVYFPRNRGSATSIPIAMYALSGMFFSTIGSVVFQHQEHKFFVFLMIVCPLMISIGLLYFRLDQVQDYNTIPSQEDANTLLEAAPLTEGTTGHGVLTFFKSKNKDEIEMKQYRSTPELEVNDSATTSPFRMRDSDDITQRGVYPIASSLDKAFDSQKTPNQAPVEVETTIKQEIFNINFLSFFLILASLQGFGQMYIYSVGYIVTAETSFVNNQGTTFNAESIQSIQVTILSLFSFLGRLTSGTISDILSKKCGLHRLWNIVFAEILAICSCILLLSHFATPAIEPGIQMASFGNIQKIFLASVIIGILFGIVFGTFPLIAVEAFNQKYYSTIWGLLTTGGFFGVRIFSKILSSDMVRHMGDTTDSICGNSTACYGYTFKCVLYLMLVITTLTIFTIFRLRKTVN
ncbi:hypothetical protein RNJ44_03144 [Nakaseomyces bracarensis]|uniref:Nodulin-like domain-containing protein n=1 Tax=Nakaseomyces bracarensis TaxID=273131 RepID=A0ABR4NYX9_9SACH